MVTENARRWPVGLHETPKRFGKLIEYHLFDAPFFSVHGKQAQVRTTTFLWNLRRAVPELRPHSLRMTPTGVASNLLVCVSARGHTDTCTLAAENGPANAENVGGVVRGMGGLWS